MPKPRPIAIAAIALLFGSGSLVADTALLEKHCHECHNEEKDKGKFEISFLGTAPNKENLDHWLEAFDLVSAEEMPPEDDSQLSEAERATLIAWLEQRLQEFGNSSDEMVKHPPRRMNNREFVNSVRDVLRIEDIGTHQPADNLIGDTLHHGFDTHGETLGFSRFHLEQYLAAARRIVDATILSGERPPARRYEIPAERIARSTLRMDGRRPTQYGKNGHFDLLSPDLYAYFPDLRTAPHTGRYRIKIRGTGKDRFVYDTSHTGSYHGDPIQISVHLGDRIKTFDLPDEKIAEIELEEWIAAGTRFEIHNPSDAFRMRGNGNFKFQYTIAALHQKEHDPERYRANVARIEQTEKYKKGNRKNLDSWHHWTEQWEGARPRLFSVEIEGPFYESWPPPRQVALIGETPKASHAESILEPIAARAWRRPVKEGELEPIVSLVESRADELGDIEALKEGIVAILVSPAFLLLNTEDLESADRFASKLSYFLQSTTPSPELRASAQEGQFASFSAVRGEILRQIQEGKADEFINAFPFAWMELNDINFMAPDPDRYHFYHRKRLSEDMTNEVLYFFRHAMEENLPLTEFLSADYSFINADLAQVYGVADEVPKDSRFRKYTFQDGRRGGLLGMAAFLTVTADSLATSPIHRAVYVMENFMGIHPTPPPPNVEISEPDVRQAKTIKEVLSAHVSDENCASCHETIDPWGYAFENFDPTGAWRDAYTIPVAVERKEDEELPRSGLWKNTTMPVDASAKFRNGTEYQDIVDYRNQLLTDANRDRFVRCFVSKLLLYANGVEPDEGDFAALDQILQRSKENEYRLVDTLAAVVDSPLFRNQ